MIDFKDMLHLRPAEIKTYRSETYDRISPSKTSFDAKGKTLLITAGGKSGFRLVFAVKIAINRIP